MKKISITYLAHFHGEMPGVENKIGQTVASLIRIGYPATSEIISIPGAKGHFLVFKSIFRAKSDVIIVRSTLFSMPLLSLAFIWQRVRGTKIVIDVPTPVGSVWHEIKLRDDIGRVGLWARLAILAVAYPWVLWPANVVLQYAVEKRRFSIGLKNKMILHTNGVDVSSIKRRVLLPDWPASSFVMIAVATIGNWHGYDRVIRGMAEYLYKSSNPSPLPRFIVVGEGPARNELEELARNLKVEEHVQFLGIKRGNELDELFEGTHVAISSLGRYRTNLESASELKSREYAARGMPIVSAVSDSDFEPLPNFVFQVGNCNDAVDLHSLIEWYAQLSPDEKFVKSVRSYACKNLDIGKKLKFILDLL